MNSIYLREITRCIFNLILLAKNRAENMCNNFCRKSLFSNGFQSFWPLIHLCFGFYFWEWLKYSNLNVVLYFVIYWEYFYHCCFFVSFFSDWYWCKMGTTLLTEITELNLPFLSRQCISLKDRFRTENVKSWRKFQARFDLSVDV